jgi:CDP-glycerol glycerophosphotransferase
VDHDQGRAVTEQAGTPLISVVLAVHGVEQYLPDCLDSVLGQQVAGLEAIAVDDASPDRCGEILDARAGQDPRLRVVHLAESAGPGPARNRGLAEARGEYVWFVDPDDLLPDGALAAVAGVLAQHHPDVLLLDYLILRRPGQTEPSPGAGLLREIPPHRQARAGLVGMAGRAGTASGAMATAAGPILTLSDRPALVDRTMTAWSKVFGRRFLIGLGVPFPPGIHEDVPVSCAALLGAERLALLDRVCYLYRRRRHSFLATTSMAHFSIFTSYERVFSRMADAGRAPGLPEVSDEVRLAVFGRAIEHYSTVLASGLVPRRARRRFFHRMAADFRRYRPARYQRPAGPRGMKIALVERDAYWLYRMLAPLNAVRVTLRRPRRGGRAARVTNPLPDHGKVK